MTSAERILVTGGAGYIGSVLVGHLLRRGYRVTVLDNLLYGQTSLLQYCGSAGFEFVRGDARDEDVLRPLVARHDTLIPLAAIVGMPACTRDPIQARTVNVDAIAALNRLRSRAQRVVYPCTNSGYGSKSGEMHCTEETPLEPVSLYGVTKVEAERLLLDSPNTITLRLATVFGVSPRMRLDLLVNDFTYRAVRDRVLLLYEKHFKRNYVHIDDVCEAFCHVLERFETMCGRPYNVGLDAANLSKEELALKIREHVPDLVIQNGCTGSDPDRRNYIVSNERIRRHGFEPWRTLDQGIRELLTAVRMLPMSPFHNA
ncbi:MAG: NAD(P)-dependent oxidoreductase [Acidobacteria bacterium]|nr:NAD(P)-dependent oxidoreductase [Acidobacteriota bacterium]